MPTWTVGYYGAVKPGEFNPTVETIAKVAARSYN